MLAVQNCLQAPWHFHWENSHQEYLTELHLVTPRHETESFFINNVNFCLIFWNCQVLTKLWDLNVLVHAWGREGRTAALGFLGSLSSMTVKGSPENLLDREPNRGTGHSELLKGKTHSSQAKGKGFLHKGTIFTLSNHEQEANSGMWTNRFLKLQMLLGGGSQSAWRMFRWNLRGGWPEPMLSTKQLEWRWWRG